MQTSYSVAPPKKPLDQEFFVPENYIPPNEEFHKELMEWISNSNEKCIIITGSPGIGKSTYINFLRTELEKNDIFVIRHHYYLSMENKDEKRYRYYDIKSSFLKQLNNTLSTSFDD